MGSELRPVTSRPFERCRGRGRVNGWRRVDEPTTDPVWAGAVVTPVAAMLRLVARVPAHRAQLVGAVRELALGAVAAEAGGCDVTAAHLSLEQLVLEPGRRPVPCRGRGRRGARGRGRRRPHALD